MSEDAPRYSFVSRPQPAIAVLATALAVGLSLAAVFTEDAPRFVPLLLWAISIITILIALGALVSTSVEVDRDGNFSAVKSLAGLPISDTRVRAEDIVAVEFDRRMTPGLERANDTGESPDRPRFCLVLVHTQGRYLIDAASAGLRSEAARLAAALDRPLKKTGDWNS